MLNIKMKTFLFFFHFVCTFRKDKYCVCVRVNLFCKLLIYPIYQSSFYTSNIVLFVREFVYKFVIQIPMKKFHLNELFVFETVSIIFIFIFNFLYFDRKTVCFFWLNNFVWSEMRKIFVEVKSIESKTNEKKQNTSS